MNWPEAAVVIVAMWCVPAAIRVWTWHRTTMHQQRMREMGRQQELLETPLNIDGKPPRGGLARFLLGKHR